MQHKLNGQRIALFESRLAEEISGLVRRSGGVPVCVPAVRERRRPAGREMAALLDEARVSRGARLRELMLYQWEFPEDTAPLVRVVEELESGAFAAAAFTTQIQARNLVTIADDIGRKERLVAALRARVLIAAVGPT